MKILYAIENWLIKVLAGKRMIVINAYFDHGTLVVQKNALVTKNTFHGPPENRSCVQLPGISLGG